MINWEEFEHLHVIRKLKEILRSWWNIEVFLFDHRANIRNVQFDPNTEYKNLVCNLLLSKEEGYRRLIEMGAKCLDEAKKCNDRHLTYFWDLGIDVAVSPIRIRDEFVGFVLAVGFHKEGTTEKIRNQLKDNLLEYGFADSDVVTAINNVRVVRQEEMDHFLQLVDLVPEEIITLHEEISSRDARISELNKELGTRYKYDAMIGKSRQMQELYLMLDKIKNSESTVLIQGENGTGKELIARAIHYNSPRKEKAFVTQNCSAFNDNLLDSELFGHVRGAFTGAVKDKKGLFQMADKGTFFLDEIGDTSPSMQVKLLRVIQEGTFIPVGGTEPVKVDCRILAATNKDLKEMVEKGEFREDLYYRINVINVTVPPLRDRKDDIPLLVDHFLEKSCKEKGVKKKALVKRAIEKIYDYSWPGNIRELENEVERLVVLAGEEAKVNVDLLSPRIREFGEKSKVQGVRVQGKLKDALEELECEMIREGLRRTGWNKSRLAKELGISRAGLIMKVEKYGLDKRRLMKGAGGR
jgi:transcriptional regulator with PAS, ATPase and Fis domain